MSINYCQPRLLYPTKPSIKIDEEIFHDKHKRELQKILIGILYTEEKGRCFTHKDMKDKISWEDLIEENLWEIDCVQHSKWANVCPILPEEEENNQQ